MEIIEKILIWSHVLAGAISLVTGILAAFVGRKGGNLHRQVGKIFFWAMFWIFISALLIISFVRFNFFLTVIAVFSFYMAFSGYRVLSIKKDMKVATIDWVAAVIAMLFGAGLLTYGGIQLVGSDFSSTLGYLSLIFGFFTTQVGWVNFRGFRQLHQQERMWWWFAHMNSMGGSFIASITAFLVQNGRIFGLPNELGWIPWVLPIIVGLPLVAYSANRYRQQFKVGKYAKRPANA